MPLASRIFRLIQYDAGGERGIRYVPRQQEGVSSGATAGYAQDMDIMLYPNALITVRPQELPEDFDPMRIHQEHTFTTYTKHYYIGSERINSKLGTVKDLGILCEQMGGYDLVNEMNTRTQEANERLNNLYQNLDKELEIDSPYLYSTRHALVCGFKYHNPKMYDSYWYHPDHLGSSSFITNTTGEISQHMEYLPFGETLVEEHLNSHNSPFKFNAKEYDAETGNYYYGARYYDPKWSMWLSVDPLAGKFPDWSPYNYTFKNPINFVDFDGREPTPTALKLAAQKLGVSIAAIRSVYKVETGGNAFRSNGDPKVLFERHYFHRYTGGKHDKSHPNISNRAMGGYGKYSEQISKLNLAVSLDEEAGYKSASYGGFQIMGANYEKDGYDNVIDFANAMMSNNEDKHLEAFTNFIMANDKLLEAIQNNDWETFAEIYNGPKYKLNNYDIKMKEAYEEFLKNPLEFEKTNTSNNNFPPPVDSSLEGASQLIN